MIPDLRSAFNLSYSAANYQELLSRIDQRAGVKVGFRVAETPIFVSRQLLNEIALAGADLARQLLEWPEYLVAARQSIPEKFVVAGDSKHPNFLTADFALVDAGRSERNVNQSEDREALVPRLVEIQAFPSIYLYQEMLAEEYIDVFGLDHSLNIYLGDLSKERFADLFRETVVGNHDPKNVVLTEIDPWHQKTMPDFALTAKRLGIAVIDIEKLVPIGKKLHYRDEQGDLVPIHRIYNRAIADEMIARDVKLSFDLTADWEVEWAGHPNWYFLISKYAVPWLSTKGADPLGTNSIVPPAVFLNEFLSGKGVDRLRAAGVSLPDDSLPGTVYENLLLKPLFSFAGKGIAFAPSRFELEAIPESEQGNYLLQQRMHFVPNVETPVGLTQAEIRILYLWPDGGQLTPVLPLVRLGRGKMMGVDHNKNQEWVGGSAALWR